VHSDENIILFDQNFALQHSFEIEIEPKRKTAARMMKFLQRRLTKTWFGTKDEMNTLWRNWLNWKLDPMPF
jgi:hypothetical protein